MSHDGAVLWSHLELDPFDEGYIDDEPRHDTCIVTLFVVPMPPDEVIEIEAEPPTIVGYPVPPPPGRGGAW
jgi:hypothetical protein